MARLYADENFPRPVVEELRTQGHDVLTAYEAGQAERGIPDEEVLAYSHTEGRAVLTLNRRHFVRLHSERPEHSGIIVCTFDPNFMGQAERISEVLAHTPELSGCLVRVNRAGM